MFQRSDSTDQIYQETNSVLCVILACRIPKNTIRKTKIGLPQKESLVSVSQRFSGVLVNALAYFIHTSLKQLRTIGERPKELMDGLSLEGAAASGVCRETSWGWVWLDLLPKEVKNTLLSFFLKYSFIMFYADLFCFLDVFFLWGDLFFLILKTLPWQIITIQKNQHLLEGDLPTCVEKNVSH